jgi:aspartyl-tRNA(Asn)/glutamyl-tRNA(Gln) amidotransferase subunit C
MSITREDISKVAELAKLHFADEELGEFTFQFQRILDYIEQLKELDVEGIEPTSHVSLSADFEKHMYRVDETRPSLPVEDSLANAPDPGKGHFRVPRVI